MVRMIKNPNAWSCLPCAFAMAMRVPLAWFLEKVGHDGSEKIWPDLSDPYCRRSFHITEMIKVCLGQNVTVTPIDYIMASAPNEEEEPYVIDNSEFVKNYLGRTLDDCVLTGIHLPSRVRHAVAVDTSIDWVYDPIGNEYSVQDIDKHFTPETMWVLI